MTDEHITRLEEIALRNRKCLEDMRVQQALDSQWLRETSKAVDALGSKLDALRDRQFDDELRADIKKNWHRVSDTTGIVRTAIISVIGLVLTAMLAKIGLG